MPWLKELGSKYQINDIHGQLNGLRNWKRVSINIVNFLRYFWEIDGLRSFLNSPNHPEILPIFEKLVAECAGKFSDGIQEIFSTNWNPLLGSKLASRITARISGIPENMAETVLIAVSWLCFIKARMIIPNTGKKIISVRIGNEKDSIA